MACARRLINNRGIGTARETSPADTYICANDRDYAAARQAGPESGTANRANRRSFFERLPCPVRNMLVFSRDSGLSTVTARMALVAVRAVVHIPVHVRVLEIAGVVIAMASRALED